MNDKIPKYAIALAKKHTGELGFIPAFRYELANAHGLLRPQRLNGDLCGYLLHGPLRPGKPLHVWQCVIQVDARRQACAFDLVSGLILDAIDVGCSRILLNCAATLDANAFWLACGFVPFRLLRPLNTRRRAIVRYGLELPQRHQAILF